MRDKAAAQVEGGGGGDRYVGIIVTRKIARFILIELLKEEAARPFRDEMAKFLLHSFAVLSVCLFVCLLGLAWLETLFTFGQSLLKNYGFNFNFCGQRISNYIHLRVSFLSLSPFNDKGLHILCLFTMALWRRKRVKYQPIDQMADKFPLKSVKLQSSTEAKNSTVDVEVEMVDMVSRRQTVSLERRLETVEMSRSEYSSPPFLVINPGSSRRKKEERRNEWRKEEDSGGPV